MGKAMKETRQCSSCGGICRKSGCERANLDSEWDIRGDLAAALTCWPRLTGKEAQELVDFVIALNVSLSRNHGVIVIADTCVLS